MHYQVSQGTSDEEKVRITQLPSSQFWVWLTSFSYMVSVVDVILVASTVVSHVVIIFPINISQLLHDFFDVPAHLSHLLLKLSSPNQIPCVIIDCLPSIIAVIFKSHHWGNTEITFGCKHHRAGFFCIGVPNHLVSDQNLPGDNYKHLTVITPKQADAHNLAHSVGLVTTTIFTWCKEVRLPA